MVSNYWRGAGPFDWVLSAAAIDLDFVHGRYYDDTLTNLLSCSRASVGYAKTAAGTLTSFATNTLRITDLGLLVEDARTNDWYTEEVGNADYSGTTTAPDGVSTANQIVPRNYSQVHIMRVVDRTTVASSRYTMSCYQKANAYNFGFVGFCEISGAQNGVAFIADLTTGLLTEYNTFASPTGVVTRIEPLANGWWRLSVTMDSSANTIFAHAGAVEAGTGHGWTSTMPVFTGDGTSGIYVWGAQLEQGAFPSSYIPTTSAAATRAADAVTTTGALNSIWATEPLSAFIDIAPLPISSASNYWRFLGGPINNGLEFIGMNATGDTSCLTYTGAQLLIANFGGGNKLSTGVKMAIGIDSSGRSLVGGGGTVATDAFHHSQTTTQLGRATGTPGNEMCGYIRRIAAWNTRLSDATLQSLTAP